MQLGVEFSDGSPTVPLPYFHIARTKTGKRIVYHPSGAVELTTQDNPDTLKRFLAVLMPIGFEELIEVLPKIPRGNLLSAMLDAALVMESRQPASHNHNGEERQCNL